MLVTKGRFALFDTAPGTWADAGKVLSTGAGTAPTVSVFAQLRMMRRRRQ